MHDMAYKLVKASGQPPRLFWCVLRDRSCAVIPLLLGASAQRADDEADEPTNSERSTLGWRLGFQLVSTPVASTHALAHRLSFLVTHPPMPPSAFHTPHVLAAMMAASNPAMSRFEPFSARFWGDRVGAAHRLFSRRIAHVAKPKLNATIPLSNVLIFCI